MYMHTHPSTPTSYICAHMHSHMHTCTNTHTHACMRMHAWTYTHTHTHTHERSCGHRHTHKEGSQQFSSLLGFSLLFLYWNCVSMASSCSAVCSEMIQIKYVVWLLWLQCLSVWSTLLLTDRQTVKCITCHMTETTNVSLELPNSGWSCCKTLFWHLYNLSNTVE